MRGIAAIVFIRSANIYKHRALQSSISSISKNFRPEVINWFFVKGVRMIVFTFMLTVGLYVMAKQNTMTVKDLSVRTLNKNGIDYICITDIARQKNAVEPKDVVKNWMRQKNTLEYLGLWERLNNPSFKEGSNSTLF